MLVDHLVKDGHEVTVLDSLKFETNSLSHLCRFKNFEFIRGDVRDEELISQIVPDFDVIFPLACLVGAPLCDKFPIEAKEVNHSAIVMMLKYLSKDQKIIYPTTNSGYGTKDGNILCDEDTKLEPISLYGQTKVNTEKVLLDSGHGVSLRLATVFGASFRTRYDLLLNNFVKIACFDKSIDLYESHFKRNFIHISDVVLGLVFIMEKFSLVKGEAFNLGLDCANISKLELAKKIQKQIPDFVITENSTEKDPDQRNYIVSNEKIAKVGFTAKLTLEDGIVEMIKAVKMEKVFNENV